MNPTDEDVQNLVTAIFTVMEGIKRATRRSPAASRLSALQMIAARPGIRPSEIAAELGLNQSSITRQIQDLESKGYVTVTPDLQDQRARRLTLTDSGRDTMTELNKFGLNRFASFVAKWDAEEVRLLTHLLIKFEESKAAVARGETSPGDSD
jgi:DNA-binding MarR family transcriptional regulator